jgi:NAD(P)-dependent dehydrogenase (short-subunit alcohol dehydrogenase family)
VRLKDKVALITGGNSGIGLATAQLFIAEGAKVVITGRNQDTLDQAAAKFGAAVATLKADVTEAEASEKAAAIAIERFGGLDIVFANAGILTPTPFG